MKRLISLAVAVMLITLLGVCRSRAYDEYNLTDLAACSSVKSDSNGKGGFVCAFSGNTVFSARLVPDFSAYSFSVGGRIRSVSQSGNYTYALVFDDALLINIQCILLILITEMFHRTLLLTKIL